MKRLIVAAAFLAFGVVSAGARTTGEDANAQQLFSVNYEDLDLSRSEDAEMMLSRLRYASMRACEDEAVTRPHVSARRAIQECRAQAVRDAVAKINAPALHRAYAEAQR